MMKQILGIGNALVDVITILNEDHILDTFSLPKGSMQLVDSIISDQILKGTSGLKRSLASGGSAANTIHGLATMGVKCGFIGSIGLDETGDFFENDMKNAGVITSLIRRKSVTGTAVALISADTERTFATHLGAAVELEAMDLHPEQFNSYDILYLEGYLINNMPLVEYACRIAREKNMEIALDLASFNVVDAHLGDFRYIIEEYADIVFANEDEARSFTGSEPEEALKILSKQCKVAIVKIGKEGSLIMRNDEIIKIGALPVTSRDTTGAGDLYAAGFLYGYSKNLDLEKCGLYGSVLAGNVIEIIGARMEVERWNGIKKYIKDLESRAK
jgi:sugar/nucleoside kinase (ribokinase family)